MGLGDGHAEVLGDLLVACQVLLVVIGAGLGAGGLSADRLSADRLSADGLSADGLSADGLGAGRLSAGGGGDQGDC
ncbi:MAG TPA: hypothetical protein VF062_25595 [Candidatus Limnocylindrales bacterium]